LQAQVPGGDSAGTSCSPASSLVTFRGQSPSTCRRRKSPMPTGTAACHRRSKNLSAVTAKTPKNGLEIMPTLRAYSGNGLVAPYAADSPVMGATGCICGLLGCGGQTRHWAFYLVLTRSANCTRQVPIANAVTVRPLTQTAGCIRWYVAGVPGLFLAGYASVKAMVLPWPGRGWWP
jgi:hypothetical protein